MSEALTVLETAAVSVLSAGAAMSVGLVDSARRWSAGVGMGPVSKNDVCFSADETAVGILKREVELMGCEGRDAEEGEY